MRHVLPYILREQFCGKIFLLENVHWCSVPVQIGDPIIAPPGECVWKKYRHRRFAIADTVAQQDDRTWIAGKRYVPQQKSPRKDNLWDVHQGVERA